MENDQPIRKKKVRKKKVTSGMKSHAYNILKILDVQNKDPEFYYHWVNKKGLLDEVAKREGMGYDIVQGHHREKGGTGKGSVIENADAVLMKTPQENARAWRKANEERSRIRVRGLTQKRNVGTIEGDIKISKEKYNSNLQNENLSDSMFE